MLSILTELVVEQKWVLPIDLKLGDNPTKDWHPNHGKVSQ